MNLYKEMFKEVQSKAFAAFREGENETDKMTMEELASSLKISTRSYSDLEHQKFAASGWVFMMFLVRIGEEKSTELLREFRKRVIELDESGATAQ